MVQTYQPYVNQIQAGAAQPCLSSYALFLEVWQFGALTNYVNETYFFKCTQLKKKLSDQAGNLASCSPIGWYISHEN